MDMDMDKAGTNGDRLYYFFSPVRKSHDSGQIASTPCCLDPLFENNDLICDMLMQTSQIVGKIYETSIGRQSCLFGWH